MVAPAPTSNGRQANKPHKISATRIFLGTLLSIAILLSGLALRLSLQLAHSTHNQRPIDEPPNKAAPPISKALAVEVGSSWNGQRVFLDNSGKYANDRVYCMVPFIWNKGIYDVIMNTWGKRCDVINFLTDAIVGGELKGDEITQTQDGYRPYWEYPAGTFPDNVIFINMTRTWNDCPEEKDRRSGKMVKKVCRHIWEKMWRSWVYVQEHHADQAEWFCKVDYDTFFFPDNLKYYVRDQMNWDPIKEHHYFGHWKSHRIQTREPMIVGASACFSRRTLNDIAQVYRDMPKGSPRGERGKCEDRAEASEEVTTSLCLKQKLNIDAEPARDDQLREYITIDKINFVLGWNRKEQGEWWFWKGKPQGAGEEEECCAHRPIGLHKYKKPEEIRKLDEQFFWTNGDKEYKRLDAKTKRYVDKVRKAMGLS